MTLMQRGWVVPFLALLYATASAASTITVAVPTLTFADEQVTADVTVRVDHGDAELRDLDGRNWWKQLDWSVRERHAAEPRAIRARSLQIIAASENPVLVGRTTQHRGVFRIGKLPSGNYTLRVARGGVEASQPFTVLNGTENAIVKERYLERQADRTTSYAAYKRIQLARTELAPRRADIWLNLASRALESGTLDDATTSYDRAIEVMHENLDSYAKREPKMAKEARRRFAIVVASIHALQGELPYYFANRDRLQVSEEAVDGAMRYVIKERRSGRVDRVIVPAD